MVKTVKGTLVELKIKTSVQSLMVRSGQLSGIWAAGPPVPKDKVAYYKSCQQSLNKK